MSGSSALDPELRADLELLAREQGCELMSVEFSRGHLRLVLDRQEGVVGIDDCTAISRQASALLDAHDFGSQRYTLEVSSPGLDRPLLDTRDYRRFSGQLARISFRDPETGAKRTIVGHYELIEDENQQARHLKITEGDSGQVSEVPLDRIHAARLEVDL